eukprot:scaffold37620_cov64-Phaeocystis_antarctica.AAC.2
MPRQAWATAAPWATAAWSACPVVASIATASGSGSGTGWVAGRSEAAGAACAAWWLGTSIVVRIACSAMWTRWSTLGCNRVVSTASDPYHVRRLASRRAPRRVRASCSSTGAPALSVAAVATAAVRHGAPPQHDGAALEKLLLRTHALLDVRIRIHRDHARWLLLKLRIDPCIDLVFLCPGCGRPDARKAPTGRGPELAHQSRRIGERVVADALRRNADELRAQPCHASGARVALLPLHCLCVRVLTRVCDVLVDLAVDAGCCELECDHLRREVEIVPHREEYGKQDRQRDDSGVRELQYSGAIAEARLVRGHVV